MGHIGRRRRPNFWNNIDRIDRPLSIPFLTSKSLRSKVLTIGAAQQQFFDIKKLFSAERWSFEDEERGKGRPQLCCRDRPDSQVVIVKISFFCNLFLGSFFPNCDGNHINQWELICQALRLPYIRYQSGSTKEIPGERKCIFMNNAALSMSVFSGTEGWYWLSTQQGNNHSY